MNKRPAVYILANKKNGTLYVGVTSDLIKRVWEHKNNLVYGFTKRYSVHKLMWYELHETMISAITKLFALANNTRLRVCENKRSREKTLKNWKRAWKMELIEENNPLWRDLYETISPLDSGSNCLRSKQSLVCAFPFRKRSIRKDGRGSCDDFS